MDDLMPYSRYKSLLWSQISPMNPGVHLHCPVTLSHTPSFLHPGHWLLHPAPYVPSGQPVTICQVCYQINMDVIKLTCFFLKCIKSTYDWIDRSTCNYSLIHLIKSKHIVTHQIISTCFLLSIHKMKLLWILIT